MKKLFLLVFLSYFSFFQSQTNGRITDSRDGIIYKTIEIGNQVWISENLNVDKFRNGDPTLEVKSNEEWVQAGKNGTPAWCYYNNDPTNGPKYGKLYNWHAVNDPRGLAPEGWHIPTTEECKLLINQLGGIGNAGLKLKSSNTWYGGGGYNTEGFNAFASGRRGKTGKFSSEGVHFFFWTSTEYNKEGADYCYLEKSKDSVKIELMFKERGFSVRCVKDKIINNGQSEHLKKASELAGEYTKKIQDGTLKRVSAEDFNISKNVGPPANLNSVLIGTQIWTTENLNVSTFRNGDPIPEARTPEEWKKAGENKQPAWCYYNNDPKNGEKYGKLYNWFAVNDPRGLAPIGWHVPSHSEWEIFVSYLGEEEVGKKIKSKPNIITVSSFKEEGGYEESYWKPCIKCQGMSDEDRKYNFCFSCQNKKGEYIKTGKFIPISKKKIDEKVNIGWNGDNQSGFNALPGGYRDHFQEFQNSEWSDKIGTDLITGWWSSTSRDFNNYSLSRTLRSSNNYLSWVASDYQDQSIGFYIRCIKDK